MRSRRKHRYRTGLIAVVVGLFRLYHEKTIDSDTLVPLLEEVDTLAVIQMKK